MPGAVLSVRELDVSVRQPGGELRKIVDGVSFDVLPGEVIALIGESGSGKSTVSLACMGYARPGCFLTGGSVYLGGESVIGKPPAELEKLRGSRISYVAQSAAAAFNAAMTIDQQVIEIAVMTGAMTRSDALAKAAGLYAALDLPNPQTIGRRYPHQLSGGQLQRAMAAMAMMNDPDCLILDEPTTALDVTTQLEVLYSLKNLIQRNRKAAIFVTHDLSIVAQMADHVMVLRSGRTVEYGTTEQVVSRPTADYTKALMAATNVIPDTILARPAPPPRSPPVLEVREVSASYGSTLALDRINLTVGRGETVGVIGESGSGKTTLGRVVSGLMAPKSGSILLDGMPLEGRVSARSSDDLRQIQFVFQMADLALNPRHRVGKILGRPMQLFLNLSNAETERAVARLLERVELPTDFALRYPTELSGGQRQRINLARALAAEPKLIICDEITSALDTIIAKQILDLLDSLQAKLGVSYLFITHDLAKVAQRLVVMQNGAIVDQGPVDRVLTPPCHEYTHLLLNSVPQLRSNWLEEAIASRRSGTGKAVTQG